MASLCLPSRGRLDQFVVTGDGRYAAGPQQPAQPVDRHLERHLHSFVDTDGRPANASIPVVTTGIDCPLLLGRAENADLLQRLEPVGRLGRGRHDAYRLQTLGHDHTSFR